MISMIWIFSKVIHLQVLLIPLLSDCQHGCNIHALCVFWLQGQWQVGSIIIITQITCLIIFNDDNNVHNLNNDNDLHACDQHNNPMSLSKHIQNALLLTQNCPWLVQLWKEVSFICLIYWKSKDGPHDVWRCHFLVLQDVASPVTAEVCCGCVGYSELLTGG